MEMDAARWERMQALFHAALDVPEPERRALLEAGCAGDPELLAGVLALLEEDANAASLLDRGLADVAHEVLDNSVPLLRTIGPYRIRSVLGQGGMGVVYLADRAGIDRRVAIKVLRDASLSPARRERFRREQQTLARLEHPSMARLYDADTLPDGTPYLVMEYVAGVPLTTYCAERRCGVPERLRLFRAVCEAVQYAHRQAIIHRDLKPSNILVTEAEDGSPSVKLLDFGIAKQLEGLEATADPTRTALRLMTPAYAAPEQLRGEPVGVYTDVYALGMMLYELLTGELPFDIAGLTPGQTEARILEHEPERPSLRARRSAAAAPGGSAHASSLGGAAWAELDVLCLTALRKDPQRRYSTVEALLRDLDHYARGEPLEARPDTLRYRTGKFLRRHRGRVAAAIMVAAVVVGLVGFYTARLAAARDVALAEAARTQRIQRFMLDLFEGGDPQAGPSDTLHVVTLIDRGAREARVLDGEPEVQAELWHTLGSLYQQLGDFTRADSLLQAALEQRRALFGPDHPEVVRSLVALGLLRVDQAAFEEAERYVREALETSRRSLLPGHPAVAEAVHALGAVLEARGDYDRAVDLLEEAVRLRAARGPVSPELAESLRQLANTHFYAGRYATSDSLNRLILVMDRELYGERHPSVADALINLGASRYELGYYTEAERFYRRALAILLAYYGPDNHETASAMLMLGKALAFQERYGEALELLRPALAIRERTYGPEHPLVASALNELGTVAVRQGDLAGAEAYYVRMIEIYRAAYNDDHFFIATGLSNLATVYHDGGQYGRAVPVLEEAVERFTRALSADHLSTAMGRLKLGHVLVHLGRYADAEPDLLAGYQIMAAQGNPSSVWLSTAREDLAAVYDALGQPEKAAQYRAESADTTTNPPVK